MSTEKRNKNFSLTHKLATRCCKASENLFSLFPSPTNTLYRGCHLGYSLRPKLSTKSWFVKQKRQLVMGIVQYKNETTPLNFQGVKSVLLSKPTHSKLDSWGCQ